MNDSAATLSVVSLFLHADIVVKGVLLLLLAASVWSWAVIIDKLWRLGAASRPRASMKRGPLPRARRRAVGDRGARTRLALVLSAGLAESTAEPRPQPETAGERRERIERAMRLVLNAELRRLEARLPFLATLGSAAPFIGLFGTVWGIMRSFDGIAAANNTSLAVVAPGIAEALFATAMGLAAAIPAVVAYNKITVDLGRFAGRMQGLIGRSGGLLARAVGDLSDGHVAAPFGRNRRRPLCAARRDQRDADGRRHAGAAGHLHGHGAAADRRRAARPAEDQGGGYYRAETADHPQPQPRRRVVHRRRPGRCRRLEPRLAALAAEDPNRIVYVRGDRTITYAQLMDMLGQVNRAGFAKVSLVAEASGAK